MNELTDIDITKVDLVDEPSNKESKIKLFKKEDDSKEEDFLYETVQDIVAKLVKPVEKGSVAMTMEQMKAKKKELAEQMKMLEKEMHGAGYEEEEMEKEEMEKPEDVKKSDEVEVKKSEEVVTLEKALHDAKEEVAKAKAELEKINEEKEVAVYVAKAKSFDKLGIEADKFGKLLREIAKSNKEGYQLLETVLTKANQNMNEVDFEEIGKKGETESVEPMTMIEKKAEEIAKSDNVSKQKAMAQFLQTKEGKELYEQHIKGGQ